MSELVKYPKMMRVLHWVMALGMIGLVVVGLWMQELEKPFRYEVYGVHKAVGVTMFGLILLRIIARLRGPVPPLQSDKTWENRLAHVVHMALYVVMIAMPISGYVMSDAGGHPVSWFGVAIPPMIEDNKALGGVAHATHGWLGWAVIALFVLHVAGVVKHRFIDKQPILERMI